MAGTNLFTPVTSTLWVALTEDTASSVNGQLAMLAKCTGAPPTTANVFEHGCLIIRTDSGTGTAGIYQNTGSSASPVWTLLDTALPGDTASSLIDTNSVTALDVGTTASAVNNLRVTNSATGAVSANAVLLSAVGTDAAVSIQVSPKGATGLLTLGLATGTGTITLGSSSAAQTVAIGAGAGVATVSIGGGVGGNTTNINAAAITAVTDTINIGTGTSTTSGGKAVNIATGVPGASTTNVIAIGSGGTTTGTVGITLGSIGNTTHTTAIQGGSGATAITLFPQTTGVVTVGAAAGTGDVVLGSSSATQSVLIGGGAGISTVSIANVTVAGANVNVATAATGAGITDTVAIATGNAAATGIKVVNIATGTPGTAGNNRVTLGGTVADSRVTVKADFVALRVANYIATEGGANNAITGSLTDAGGTNVPLVAGLKVVVKLAHTLQAGANTFDFNGGGAVAIKMHTNAASDLGTAYAATGIIELMWDGTAWLDMSQ